MTAQEFNNLIFGAKAPSATYDYDLQVWVKAGRVLPCSHPNSPACRCPASKHQHKTVAQARQDAGLAAAEVK